MIYLNKYCPDFMFLVVMLCVAYSSTILSLIIFISYQFLKYHSCLLKFLSTCIMICKYHLNHLPGRWNDTLCRGYFFCLNHSG